MADIFVCGLFENELLEKGLMEEGRCRDCFYYNGFMDRDRWIIFCEKEGDRRLLKEEKTDCEDWVIDTR